MSIQRINWRVPGGFLKTGSVGRTPGRKTWYSDEVCCTRTCDDI